VAATASKRRPARAASTPDSPASPNRRGLWGLAVALAVAAVAGIAVFFVYDSDPVGPDPERVEELRQEEDERHVAQVGDLIDLTGEAYDTLLPVLEGLPADADADPEPDTGEWSQEIDALVEELADAPSAATEYNVARNALRNSVELFGSAVQANDAAAQADGEEAEELVDLAASLREQGVYAWSVSATQLDLLAIGAGYGHVHIYLPADPGSDALQPDGQPEGAEAADDPEDGGE
jgi:hypothetical protein